MNACTRTHIQVWILSLVASLSAIVQAQTAEWRVVKPSNTGIPGEEVRFVRFAPDGLLWVGARWPFWQEGGVGILDRSTNAWTTHANWETPLPSEYVNGIEFASDGTAWIATGAGLVRFDGTDWTVYDTSNSPLLHNTISDIDLDADGHVWINNSGAQTSDAAIFEFDGVNWTRFRVGTELPWDLPWVQLSDVMVGSDGHVWVSNDVLNGVAEYDGQRWTLHGDTVGRFGALMEDLDGNIWMKAGVGGGNSFWKFDRTSFTHFPVASTPTAMAVDDDGSVFISHWGGQILRTTDGGQTWSTYLSGLNIIVDIEPDPGSDDVWVGTLGAVGHFTGAGTWVRDYNSYNTGMPWYWVDYMSTDLDGNFWIATGEAGLSRFDGTRWRNWGEHNAGAEPYPFAGNEPMSGAYHDQTGTLWMGGNGIAAWDPVADIFRGFWNWQNNPGMGVTQFPYFAADANGELFAASEYGTIYRFDGVQWVTEPVSPYAASGLPGMEADSQGNVWIAAWFDIHKWDGAAWSVVTLPDPNYFFDLGGINSMAIGPDDVMWFGTEDGLVRWDGATWALYDTSNSPLPSLGVKGVDVRGDGLIGLSAHEFGAVTPFPNGVAVIDGDINDPASWSVWRYEDSAIPHYQIERVAFDAVGDLWVSALSEGAAVLHYATSASIVSAASCVSHGPAGELCLDLLPGEVEPRLEGVGKLTFQLDQPVTSVGAAVSCANGSYSGVVSTTVNGADVVVSFSPALPDRDCCTVTLDGDAVDSFSVRTVAGDVNRNGAVTTLDASIIKPQFNGDPAVDGPEFDVNADGSITTADFSEVKPLFNNTAPACP